MTGWTSPTQFMTWFHVFRQSSPELATEITFSTFEQTFSVRCHVLPQQFNSYWLEIANIAWICNYLFMFSSHVPCQICPTIGDVRALLAVKRCFVMVPFHMAHNAVFCLHSKPQWTQRYNNPLCVNPVTLTCVPCLVFMCSFNLRLDLPL